MKLKLTRKARRARFFGLMAGAVALAAAFIAYPALVKEKTPLIRVYFLKGEKLFAVERKLAANEAPLTKAIAELLAGPSQEEQGQGIFTELPAGTRCLGIKVKGRIAILNFNRKIGEFNGGAARLRGMIAQIIYTATEVAGIDRSWIWVEGQKEVVLGGEGLVLDQPLSRAEFAY